MRVLRSMIVGVVVAGFLGCASVSVKTDYDRSVDFSGFKTYHWDNEPLAPQDALAKNPILRKRIKNAVDQVLQGKGFEVKASGPADFAVAIHAGVEERVRVTNWGNYGWNDYWRAPYGGPVEVSQYTLGSLIIDIISGSTRELAWRGIGEGIVREYTDNEKMETNILKTVTEILQSFPPGVKGGSKKR